MLVASVAAWPLAVAAGSPVVASAAGRPVTEPRTAVRGPPRAAPAPHRAPRARRGDGPGRLHQPPRLDVQIPRAAGAGRGLPGATAEVPPRAEKLAPRAQHSRGGPRLPVQPRVGVGQ